MFTDNPRRAIGRWTDARRRRQRLVRELAGYRTPHERAELGAILARYPTADVVDLERLHRRSQEPRRPGW
jgi:hypothetical protein